jgi:hypothetical protein
LRTPDRIINPEFWEMIDTLKLAKGLQEAGMSREQAESVAEALRDAQTDYVTRADLNLALAKLEARLVWWIVGTIVIATAVSIFFK